MFRTPKLPRVNPITEASLANLDKAKKADREIHQEALNEASVRIQREALQHSLDIQHRTMLIALFAVIITTIASTAAVIVSIIALRHS